MSCLSCACEGALKLSLSDFGSKW